MYSVETGEWEQWEDLSQNLWGHSCTRVDNLVVVAGGVNPSFAMVATTFILDLDTRQQRVVGDLQADMQAVFNDDQTAKFREFFKSSVSQFLFSEVSNVKVVSMEEVSICAFSNL